jgi:hypothetical protein
MNPRTMTIRSLCLLAGTAVSASASFTPLAPLSAPRIVAASPAYPGGQHEATRLLDGEAKTEFSSNGAGVGTYAEFEFPAATVIGAFRHVNRDDPGTVAASELVFADDAGRELARHAVTHDARRAGETFFALPAPVTARRVKWTVRRIGAEGVRTVGGAEIGFFTAGPQEPLPSRDTVLAQESPIVPKSAEGPVQTMRLTITHPYAEAVDGVLRLGDAEPKPLRLTPGSQSAEWVLPAVTAETSVPLTLEVAGQPVVETRVPRRPVRPLTVYVLPHSHTDIGYTEIQTEIEDKQVQNLVNGMAIARRTAGYPEGARFVWNVEVLWAADLYLRRLGEAERSAFLEAVKSGQVALNGMYLNELTGLCRPEELIRLFRMGTQLAGLTETPVESAMISDVPGYTWGSVPAMAQAGIKYFSVAPNYFDRIGDILVQWENKPFYWLGPDGRSRVLVWIPFWGYAMSHRYHRMSPRLVQDFCDGLARRDYPYDIAHVRWSGVGDNAVPDPAICDFIREWNETHVSPRFVISSTTEAFRAFEERYGDTLPKVSGDWTPYWEDGAGSSALETAVNRASSDRVTQAETLWATFEPRGYPAGDFESAWRHVLLYSEHTWGAWCSIGEPARRETREQWAIKQSYAVTADLQSRELLSRGLALASGPPQPDGVDVFNTSSWARSELVVVPKFLSEGKNRARAADGQPVPSQRLRSGELVLGVEDVPAFARSRFQLSAGDPAACPSPVSARGTILENGVVSLRVDESTGGIVELRVVGHGGNLADTAGGQALNEYVYFNGSDAATARRNGPVTLRVGEPGPLVASLVIESDAPGCHRLVRELRLAAGADHIEIVNTLDKDRLVAASYHAIDGKESVNFGFPFAVPGGQLRLEVPFGVLRPDDDQIPSACKNWFTVGRWADVSNGVGGVTWVTLDAPLVQAGGLTANLLNSQSNPAVWHKHVGATQKVYSWAMNNHWGTNYRAYQEGPHTFRYVLRPHRGYDPAAASRLAIAASQPLLPAPARGEKPTDTPRVRLTSTDVLATAFKPSDDGQGLILRLWNATGREAQTELVWGDPAPRAVTLSDTSERAGRPCPPTLTLPPWNVVTVRADLP